MQTDEQKPGEGQGDSSSEGKKEEKPSVDDLAKQLDELKNQNLSLQSTNERLLNESKTHKENWLTTKQAQEKIEKERLEKEGNWQELLQREREEKENAVNQLKAKKTNLIKYKVFNEVQAKAKDCVDPSDILGYSGFWDDLEIEEGPDDDVLIKGLDESLAKVREAKPHYFKTQAPTMANNSPSNTAPAKKGQENLSVHELARAYAQGLYKK